MEDGQIDRSIYRYRDKYMHIFVHTRNALAPSTNCELLNLSKVYLIKRLNFY